MAFYQSPSFSLLNAVRSQLINRATREPLDTCWQHQALFHTTSTDVINDNEFGQHSTPWRLR